MRYQTSRRSLATLGFASLFVAILAATINMSPMMMPVAEAQSTETDSFPAVQLPPWLPGEDFDPAGSRATLATDDAAVAGTPAAPVTTAEGATVADAPENAGAMTASLGGSDVAVSSVGGSYEVDSPKKRSKGKK